MSDVAGPILESPADALQRRIWLAVSQRFTECQSGGLTQADLGRALGAPRSQVNVWLKSPERMTLKAAARLLAAMDAEVLVAVRTREETMRSAS